MPRKLLFYFDENFSSSIARALNILVETESNIEIKSTSDVFGKGIKDVDLIPKIAKNKGILITHDRKMASRKAEKELLDTLKVSTVFVNTANQKYWDQLQMIIKYWPKLLKETQSILKKEDHFFADLKSRSGLKIW